MLQYKQFDFYEQTFKSFGAFCVFWEFRDVEMILRKIQRCLWMNFGSGGR
jgi:hypothetical protein